MLLGDNLHFGNGMDRSEPASPFSLKPVVPFLEMAAYEALWLHPTASYKTIAALFEQNPGALPSDLVSESERRAAEQRLRELLGTDISKVSVRVHGAGEYPRKLRDAD